MGPFWGVKFSLTTSNQNVSQLLAKSCVLLVFYVVSTNASTMAATRTVASNEALDVLHRAMCPALYRHICVAIEITSNSPAFFVVID